MFLCTHVSRNEKLAGDLRLSVTNSPNLVREPPVSPVARGSDSINGLFDSIIVS